MYRLRIEDGCRAGERVPLPEGPCLLKLGRGYQADVRFPADATMSRVHAELRGDPQGWTLVNLSQHGTLVHGQAIGERRLAPGDVVTLGDTKLVFERDTPSGSLPQAAAEFGALPGPPRPAARPDALTPNTPTIATPPAAAGYDADGQFHMGLTVLGKLDEGQTSFVWLAGAPNTPQAIGIKVRRLYFFLVVSVLGMAGCLVTGALIVLPALLQFPDVLLGATLFALLPAIPYTLGIKLLDRNDQIPWSNYLGCLMWGATVGCGLSLVVNTFFGEALKLLASPEEATNLVAVFVAPLVEETAKGMGLLVLFWILHDEFDNVLEGMVLGAASGLGFALVENVVYDVGFLQQAGAGGLFLMGSFRSVCNALIGHPVYTAMSGAGLGLMRETARGRPIRWLYPPLGLCVAIGLHVTWNGAAVLLSKALDPAVVNPLVTLAILAVVFGGAGTLFFLAAYLFAASRERRVLLKYLAEEVEKGFIESDELQSFQRLLGRQRYEWAGLMRGGIKSYRLRRALRRAQVELAFRKWHLAQGDAVRGSVVDALVHQARTRIRDARNALNKLEGRGTLTTQARPLAPPPAAPPAA